MWDKQDVNLCCRPRPTIRRKAKDDHTNANLSCFFFLRKKLWSLCAELIEVSIHSLWSEHIYCIVRKPDFVRCSGSQQDFIMRGVLSLSNQGTPRYG